jgi:hypothetical protein
MECFVALADAQSCEDAGLLFSDDSISRTSSAGEGRVAWSRPRDYELMEGLHGHSGGPVRPCHAPLA